MSITNTPRQIKLTRCMQNLVREIFLLQLRTMHKIASFACARHRRSFGLIHDILEDLYWDMNIIGNLIEHCTQTLSFLMAFVSISFLTGPLILINAGITASTFLSTERNGLVSIYNVSRHNGHLIRADDLPYGILPSRAYCRYTGRAFMQHESQGITIFRTDEQEKVHCFQLQKAPVTDLELPEPLVVEQSDAVRELGKSIKTDLDKYGDQDKVVTDLYPAYDSEYNSHSVRLVPDNNLAIFRIHTEQQERLEEEQAEEFYDVMDRLPTFWQTSDVPSEHMLTRRVLFISAESQGH